MVTTLSAFRPRPPPTDDRVVWRHAHWCRVETNYFLNPVAGGTGPELKYGGAAFTANSTWGAWAPIGAEAISGGYEVAFKIGTDSYTVLGHRQQRQPHDDRARNHVGQQRRARRRWKPASSRI